MTPESIAAPPLRLADRGPRVAALRGLLERAGQPVPICPEPCPHTTPAAGRHAGEDPQEYFDAHLEVAVRAFQQRRGLVADGVVGPQTARGLDAARWRLGDRILLHTPGHLMRGDDVAALQERLVVLGMLAGPVDGVFGSRTEIAMRELQRGLGLESDGLCGPDTLRAMDALSRAIGGGDPWALRQQADVAVAGASLAGKTVIIDPAHGGGDPGQVANGLSEAEVVLDLARRVEGRLAATGVHAVLTRGAGSCPGGEDRAWLAAEAGADVLVSLHCDGNASPQASGVATFYWGDARIGARSATGRQLATLVQREVVARTGMADLRTHACTFDILRLTRMPAVQVELGYLTNAEDAQRLADPLFRDVVAEALVVAIQRLYLGEDDRATGTLRLDDVMARAGLFKAGRALEAGPSLVSGH
ncbi:MAG TPA: N-acetylmuramoyl-L-alanine amidase [Kineosporiaceae bacterium]|nr:N-acetylmuramoyl-L-alanine amidase [Kineosporiaceae bacterium]